ncbi:DUF4126 domain-containing protein [Jatrophihabitans sp.]|jgi:uncharacterized membrane protein|uniref:DUF4126 domain-containing protein n=1 Tax=Jatrophihabitans sp. TaxID=1932789 RepID=UPI002F179BFB
MSVLTRAALLGLATGARSTSGLAALALTTSSGILGNRWARRLSGVAAAGEFVGDKLPQTPSRLQPEGLAPRLILGAVTGALLTRREGGSRNRALQAGALGLLGATAGSQLGVSWRQLAARRFGRDVPGALIEDAWAAAAARYASRRR